jgi:phosphoglycerol transferase MdoB-like AlkP superfamily enzyme
MATEPSGSRSVLATIVGFCLVAVIVLVLFHFVIGTVLWLFRTAAIIAVVLVAMILYLKLKSPPD